MVSKRGIYRQQCCIKNFSLIFNALCCILFDDFGDGHRPNVTTRFALYDVLESVLSINLVCDLVSFDRHMNCSSLPHFTKLIR